MFRRLWYAFKELIFGRRHFKDIDIYANTPDIQLSCAFKEADVHRVKVLCRFYQDLEKQRYDVRGYGSLNTLEYSCYLDLPELIPFFLEQLAPLDDIETAIQLSMQQNHPECLLALIQQTDIQYSESTRLAVIEFAEHLEDVNIKQSILEVVQDEAYKSFKHASVVIYGRSVIPLEDLEYGSAGEPMPRQNTVRY